MKPSVRRRASFAASLLLAASIIVTGVNAQSAAGHPEWPGKGQLFVGTCYQPVDRSPEEIHRDIAIMKKAGFKLVRMGDLSWDSFEPAEGQFTFEWFDKVMDEMAANGIKVVLDIPGQPAPTWLHHKYPGANLVTQNGTTLHPAERYMQNITDPDYRRLAVRMADTLTKRYAHHPALMAIGYNNEFGNSYMSYSAADRLRFVDWLKAKYGSVDALNKAWASQRWSRHINTWDEVELPYGDGPGPAERYLDLRRFWSDQTITALKELEAVRKENVPDKPAVSNLWDTAWTKPFDYLGSYRDYATYGAEGFYPGEPVGASLGARMIKGDLETPIWFNEFTAGGVGYYGAKGRSRMWAYMALIDQAQTILAWTFNSHLGGEEQALFGLVDHDNTPSWKVDEFAQISREFATLEKLGFPRLDTPQVAIAYSFDSAMVTATPGQHASVTQYYKTGYMDQVQGAYEPLFTDNIDADVVKLSYADLAKYKLVIVPGQYLMDEKSANAVRRYVENGGTAIMTGYSAKADASGQWFDTPLPGRLTDVFGLHTNAFYRADTPLQIKFGSKTVTAKDRYYEVLELDTAKPLATFQNTPEKSAAITINRYGKGQAIYLATASQTSMIGPLVRSLYPQLAITRGPQTPAGVYARVVDGRTLYVNSTTKPVSIAIHGTKTDVLSGKRFSGKLVLQGYGVGLLQ
ncbi:beta-galactosidase [Rhizomicrobium electricum]|uniref:beta-galactosidase n=1 Tax=Rhizomicrobium electricum TaxID=480070 RepID=A0ABN1FBI8_9PROT|nr:beta-galactosidase [Rhizomicrobium electricum]NIJ50759.1 beta-galactosidase [Rhizomicrobium electricum]